jgi:hypothetical protein
MKVANIAELKNHLGDYLRLVENGENAPQTATSADRHRRLGQLDLLALHKDPLTRAIH